MAQTVDVDADVDVRDADVDAQGLQALQVLDLDLISSTVNTTAVMPKRNNRILVFRLFLI